jgi:hypothetical protein
MLKRYEDLRDSETQAHGEHGRHDEEQDSAIRENIKHMRHSCHPSNSETHGKRKS